MRFLYGEIIVGEDTYEIDKVYNANIKTEREYEEGDYDNPTFLPIFSIKNLTIKIYDNQTKLQTGKKYDVSLVFENNDFQIEFEETFVVKEYDFYLDAYYLKVK